MSTTAQTDLLRPASIPTQRATTSRVASVDALRGLTVFTMIFVNDLAGASNTIVPPWMKHFHGRSGMTFVDLVFPAFLFIVGMSLPLALGARLRRGEPHWKIAGHIILRTLSLLVVGILMVNGTPDSGRLGWSGNLWETLMYLSAVLAFCTVRPKAIAAAPDTRAQVYRSVSAALRFVGFVSLLWLALVYRGQDGHRILQLAPFAIHHEWYGILGLIGWAYLVGAIVFLTFGTSRTALLASTVLLMCLYPADRAGAFADFWLARHVGIGGMIGSQGAITVAGLLLATVLVLPESSLRTRIRFTVLFVVGCGAAALLLQGLYGINKNQATPSWCLWSCAITAALWLTLHVLADKPPSVSGIRPLIIAGENVFLAYLLSEMLPSLIELSGLAGWYGQLATPHLVNAIGRSLGCAVLVLGATAGLNALGFRLRL